MLYKLYWNQWCSDTRELVNGLPEALAQPQQVSALAVTFERLFLELKASHPSSRLSTLSHVLTWQLSSAPHQRDQIDA